MCSLAAKGKKQTRSCHLVRTDCWSLAVMVVKSSTRPHGEQGGVGGTSPRGCVQAFRLMLFAWLSKSISRWLGNKFSPLRTKLAVRR